MPKEQNTPRSGEKGQRQNRRAFFPDARRIGVLANDLSALARLVQQRNA